MKSTLFDTNDEILTSNVGQSGTFGITQTGLKVVSEILRNRLYHNKIAAPIREYISNAYDAQVMSGKKHKPLVISLPTLNAPTFAVRDFGDGLTEDEVADLYTKYGESTKRNTNKTIGSFGIGCKSAFCISNNFLVTTYKNGRKSIYNCYLEDGDGKYAKMHDEETTDENGVEISIPVNSHQIHEWLQEYLKFSKHIDPQPKLLGVDYNYLVSKYGGVLSSNEIFLEGNKWKINVDNNSINPKNQVVMGIVAYPFDYNQVNKGVTSGIVSILNKGITFFAPIGAVDPTANREGLEYTEKTIKYIRNRLLEAEKEIKDIYQKEFDKCANLFEAKCYLIEKNSDRFFNELFRPPYKWQNQIVADRYIEFRNILVQDRYGYHKDNTKPILKVLKYCYDSYADKLCKEKYYIDNTGFIPTKKDVYIINDLNLEGRLLNNRIGKICADLRDDYHARVFVFNLENGLSLDDLLKTEFNILPLKKLSDIPENEYWRIKTPSTNTNLVKAPTSKILVFDQSMSGRGGLESRYWKAHTLSDSDKGYYVELDRFQPVLNEEENLTSGKLSAIIEFLSLYFGINDPIYGFKIGYLTDEKKKSLSNLKPLFESLDNLILDYLKKNNIEENYKIYKALDNSSFNSKFNKITYFFKKLPIDHALNKGVVDLEVLIKESKENINKHNAFIQSLNRIKNKEYFSNDKSIDPYTEISLIKNLFDLLRTKYPYFLKIYNEMGYYSLEKFLTPEDLKYFICMDKFYLDIETQKQQNTTV